QFFASLGGQFFISPDNVLGFADDPHFPHSAQKTDRDQSARFALALNRKFFAIKTGHLAGIRPLR
ncbi:hypothetical protein ACLMJV_29515, partial [Sinorhizobium meliloti]|uniref:hypothetical protein n=1 Tax=Rhizobium meliloti TaxID=382 RepID=UPI00398CC1F3